MRFTAAQYDAVMEALTAAKEQLAPDGQCCRICCDTSHQAWECGHNPLYAMAVCDALVIPAIKLHERLHEIEEKLDSADQTAALVDWREDIHAFLHYVAGFEAVVGRQIGPARVAVPDESQEEIAS